jgi:murein DD-endopeptidase MepM/ murein hydrolase activator NlpD
MVAHAPVIVEFPLPGEWRGFRTPAASVPTHGTDFLGQRYAFDFVRPTGQRFSPFGPNVFLHFCIGVPSRAFPAWGAPVLSATSGTVIGARDGDRDQPWIHGFWSYVRLAVVQRFFPVRINANDWSALAGNHVLVESEEGVAFYAHLQRSSIRVREGQHVAVGEPIGLVGHSGRSAIPHLHFHLMDRVALDAVGIPCGFRAFERWSGGGWLTARGYPSARETVRGTPPAP